MTRTPDQIREDYYLASSSWHLARGLVIRRRGTARAQALARMNMAAMDMARLEAEMDKETERLRAELAKALEET